MSLASCSCALALADPIGGPEFGHSGEISEAQKQKIYKMLKFMREELEFVDGRFINEYSHQRYNGSSKKIGEFLKILTEAAPDPVTIEFRDFGKDDKTAFHLSQVSARTTVIVNTNREDLRLTDFKDFIQAKTPPAPVQFVGTSDNATQREEPAEEKDDG